mmetsp:Transcript_48138/g.121527  ORF Transcript_48138/g.121527 Transcript_48138/m.121527 type:complete len:252 (-) Transcript_48138:59-814(-)
MAPRRQQRTHPPRVAGLSPRVRRQGFRLPFLPPPPAGMSSRGWRPWPGCGLRALEAWISARRGSGRAGGAWNPHMGGCSARPSGRARFRWSAMASRRQPRGAPQLSTRPQPSRPVPTSQPSPNAIWSHGGFRTRCDRTGGRGQGCAGARRTAAVATVGRSRTIEPEPPGQPNVLATASALTCLYLDRLRACLCIHAGLRASASECLYECATVPSYVFRWDDGFVMRAIAGDRRHACRRQGSPPPPAPVDIA